MQPTPTDFLRLATTTAEHYGFRSVETLKRDPLCRKCTDNITHNANATERKIDNIHGLLTAGMNAYCKEKLNGTTEPALFYTIEQVPRSGETAIAFHMFGVSKSIAEATLIHVSRALATEAGYDDHTIRINSLGDRDSVTRYTRELTNYFRKRINDLPPEARERLKDHVFSTLDYLIEVEHELAYRSPNPMEYLSDPSRKHFREIIEYLDMSEAPYEIDPTLMGHYACYSDAMFRIDTYLEQDEERVQAPLTIRGGRYDEFVHRTTKRPISAVGAVAILRDTKAPIRSPRIKLSTPSVYIVQLGFGPKIKSLMLIDELRRSGVPVHQNLASNSLSEQLRDAEKQKVKYVVIVGQKEFVDGTVILRDMAARNQESIGADSLAARLRRVAQPA